MDKTVKNVMEGKLTASGLKIGVVCARFNAFFVEKLLEGAVDAFVRHGGSADDLAVA
ncbi:MAG: 6,7-dimethyl-8-ribityllumazine synthase, partial [Lentisphaeria bacterium]|nr:6,7-dimethyl-8-ribityllumazine synthase [Lentisphaeria bacterium]